MTNFHAKITTKKGTHMPDREQSPKHLAKTPSHRTGIFASRSSLLRGPGTSAHSRTRALLAVIALAITAFMISAAPASAAPPTVTTPVVSDVSYASVHVEGEITTDGSGGFGATAYQFQISTDNVNWSLGKEDSLVGPKTNEEVKADITEINGKGLKGGIKYYVRLTAENFVFGGPVTESISPGPNPEFTTLAVAPPVIVSVDNASDVAYTTATVKGKITRPANPDPAFDVDCHFQYVTDEQFTSNPPGEEFAGATPVACEPENPVHAAGTSGVEAKLTGLVNNAKYHLRLVVSNASPTGDTKVAASTFTTLTVDPPSVISIDDAGEVEYTQAQVKGVVERPDNADPAFDVTCNFEYITDEQFNLNSPGEEFLGATPVACDPNPVTAADTAPGTTKTVTAALTGLVPSTIYHLRLAVSNEGGADAEEAAATFTTAGPIPKPAVLATDDAKEVKIFTAQAEGEIERPAGADPALDTSCRFEYVSDQQFDDNVTNIGSGAGFEGAAQAFCNEAPPWAPLTSPGPGHPAVSAVVKAELTGLTPGTTYHLRLAAENLGGVNSTDATSTFTTLAPELPNVTIDPVEGGTFTTAHVSGTIQGSAIPSHPNLAPFFEISTDGGSTWSRFEAPSYSNKGDEIVSIEHDYANLLPSTTYFFRIGGTYSGEERDKAEANGEIAHTSAYSITTEPPTSSPTAENLAVTDVTATTAHFSATVNPNAPAGPLSPLAKKAYETKWHFECTPECKDANGNEIGGTIQGEEGEQPVFGDVKRLEPGTHYEVRLIVSSAGGGETKVETFDTDKLPPSVNQTPGAPDGEGGYTLQGVVNPNNETVTGCKFEWGPDASKYAFSADCSPLQISGSKSVTVEAHLTGLTLGVDYHALLVVTYGAGSEAKGVDQKFKATPATKQSCPANEQQRTENNSLALPECRAYEMVTPPGKEGFNAALEDFSGGDRVLYVSGAGNIAKSGQGGLGNFYVTNRTAAGWETIPNLNGSSGSLFAAPSEVDSDGPRAISFSADLLSSLWPIHRKGGPAGLNFYLRNPDGTFTLIGPGDGVNNSGVNSADLSHLVRWANSSSSWTLGPGMYEYVGTGLDQPRRVDVDNSAAPITSCTVHLQGGDTSGFGQAISRDGRVVVFWTVGGCGGANPPSNGLWARINGTTSIDVSASQCNRPAADPGGLCNGPVGSGGCTTAAEISSGASRAVETGPGCRGAHFEGVASDGSRIFFTTKQQLVDSDTDQTSDLYACDIPSGNPAATSDKANHCTALMQLSAAQTGAGEVENVLVTSDNGNTALFTAKGVLADNEDALGEKALVGDHNLYVWHATDDNPDGETTFVGRLVSNDLNGGTAQVPQSTPDGRFVVFTTANQLVETDTDTSRDAYRVDAETGELTRISTNVLEVGGNGPFDAEISKLAAISDDGQKVVFITTEGLSSADGNGEPDVYLWTPDRVSLITTGSVTPSFGPEGRMTTAIEGSGRDIFFTTTQQLTPSDADDSGDVYDARIGGGFSFAQAAPCSGEACQPEVAPAPAREMPSSAQPGTGNPSPPKPCPKGKVRKHGKCVKKSSKKHHKHSHKKTGHNRGGSK